MADKTQGAAGGGRRPRTRFQRASRPPAEAAFADCRSAFLRGDYASCIRHSARVLALAEDDPLLVASVCWMRGGIEEMRGRRGLALRTWGYGFELARAAGLRNAEIYSLLRRSIDSLVEWPRVLLSHSPADAALAAKVRGELEKRGLQVLDCDSEAAAPAADRSLLRCLDRVTVLFVFWSSAYARDVRLLSELEVAHRRLAIWHELAAATRLLFLQVDSAPLPRRFAEVETIDLRSGLDGARCALVARAARHPRNATAGPASVTH